MGLAIGVFITAALWSSWQVYVHPDNGHHSMPGMHCVAASSTALSRGAFCYSVSCPPVIPTIWWGIQLWGLAENHPISLLPCMVGRGLFNVWLHLMTQLTVLGIQPDGSGLVIWYQGDVFTCTWSEEWFVAHSHIYPGFTNKVSPLTPCQSYQ